MNLQLPLTSFQKPSYLIIKTMFLFLSEMTDYIKTVLLYGRIRAVVLYELHYYKNWVNFINVNIINILI